MRRACAPASRWNAVFRSAQPIDTAEELYPAGAEVGLPVVQNFNTKDIGLYPETWAILQDRRGLLYVGISGGTILEYDGVTWRKIFTQPA